MIQKRNPAAKAPMLWDWYTPLQIHARSVSETAISRMNGFKSSYQETVQFPKRKNEGMEDIVWQDCRRKMI